MIETVLVLGIVGLAVLYLGYRAVRTFGGGGGCSKGCGSGGGCPATRNRTWAAILRSSE